MGKAFLSPHLEIDPIRERNKSQTQQTKTEEQEKVIPAPPVKSASNLEKNSKSKYPQLLLPTRLKLITCVFFFLLKNIQPRKRGKMCLFMIIGIYIFNWC